MPYLWVCGLFGGTNADTVLLGHILLEYFSVDAFVLLMIIKTITLDLYSLYMSYFNGDAYNFLYFKFSLII